MRSYYAYHVLMNLDPNCENYIGRYGSANVEFASAPGSITTGAGRTTGGMMTLQAAIEKGLKEEAHQITNVLMQEKKPLDIINEHLIPALDTVGKGFEKGTVFLPQLLMSAEAAKTAFAVLKEGLENSGDVQEKKKKSCLRQSKAIFTILARIL